MNKIRNVKKETHDKFSAMQKILSPMDIKSTPKYSSMLVRKTLLIRFSSLGDVILSLSAARALAGKEFDFVTSLEFESLLKGHPGLNHLYLLKRKTGLINALRDLWNLAQKLALNQYDQVIDLHNSLRSRVLRIFLWSLNTPNSRSHRSEPIFKRVKVVQKQRMLRLLSILSRGMSFLSPTPWVERFAQLGGDKTARPMLGYLLMTKTQDSAKIVIQTKTDLLIMPGSKWPAKRLSIGVIIPVLEELLLQNPKLIIGVLGSKTDDLSTSILRIMADKGHTLLNLTGDYDYKDLANLMASSKVLLSADTGFAHLAEGLGIPVITLYGPTTPSLGFAPHLKKSYALKSSLWCSPCSKDGSRCLRPFSKYKCMEKFNVSEIRFRVAEMLK